MLYRGAHHGPLGRGTPYDVAIDLGTAYVRVFAHGRGLVAEEPSVVRVWRSPLALESAGTQATGRGPGGQSSFPVRPLRKGVVWDAQSAGWLLSAMLRRARGVSLIRPTVLACAPTDARTDELDSLREALCRAGASSTTIVPEPLAAAVGAGLDLTAPYAQLLVDVGEGVTDVAVIREGRIETSLARRFGCSDLRSAVADQVAIACGRLASDGTIDALIRQADASRPEDEKLSFDFEERSASGKGLAHRATVERTTVLASMEPIVGKIAGAVRAAWSRLPEKTAREVGEKGVCLTGGGARLRTLVERVARATSVEVRVPANPLHAVIMGASRMAVSSAEH